MTWELRMIYWYLLCVVQSFLSGPFATMPLSSRMASFEASALPPFCVTLKVNYIIIFLKRSTAPEFCVNITMSQWLSNCSFFYQSFFSSTFQLSYLYFVNLFSLHFDFQHIFIFLFCYLCLYKFLFFFILFLLTFAFCILREIYSNVYNSAWEDLS